MIVMVPVDQIRALDIFSGRTFLVLNNHQNEQNYLMSYKKVACICFFIQLDMQKLAQVVLILIVI